MSLCKLLFVIICATHFRCAKPVYTVTIYPQILSQNGRTRFESDRWDGHNGMDRTEFIAGNKNVGSRAGRWINPDLGGVFQNAPEDPNRKGYPDPSYFASAKLQSYLCGIYIDDINGYGENFTLIMETKSQEWPSWMDTSLHGGIFPNNLDAATDFLVLMISAVYNCTGGVIPRYFEVINEPESMYPNVTWDIVIQYHKLATEKLHAKFPKLKVGGPTRDGIIALSDANNFQVWNMNRDFIDMSLFSMDFFSFHPYNWLYSYDGKHNFTGIVESRLQAVIDLLEAYAFLKGAKVLPIVTSEFGLSRRYVDVQTPRSLVQWGYIFTYNTELFTFLDNRDVMEQAVAFLLCDSVGEFGNASIFYTNGTETPVAYAYRFWKNFNESHEFIKAEGEFSGHVRMVSPLALVDRTAQTVTVLLHNRAQTTDEIQLNFVSNWVKPKTAQATCLYLDSEKRPVFRSNKTIFLTDNIVELPPEGTCFFVFKTHFDFSAMATIEESKIYSGDLISKILNNVVETTLFLPSTYNISTGTLRIAISFADKTAWTQPSTVYMNGHELTRHHSLYDSYRTIAGTLWDVYNYDVPASYQSWRSVVRMEFAQSGGYVTSVTFRYRRFL